MRVDEEWRAWRNGDYEVSSLGRIRRATLGRRTWPGRLLNPIVGKVGYLVAGITVAGRNAPTYVHAMVAECFLGPRPEGLEINHIDGDKTNARASNLEYVTHRGNMRHARDAQLLKLGERHGNAKLSDEAVIQIRARRASGEGVSALAREYGVSPGHVCWIAKGKRRRAG